MTEMHRMNDPEFLSKEYEDESRLAARRRVWNEFLDGTSSDDATYMAVVEAAPSRVLEVGAGWGELAVRIRDGTGAWVVATDRSQRMAMLARHRDLPVAITDAQALPFRDDEFDVVVANAMLYHLPDLDLGLRNLRRVLSPGGSLVATTFGRQHLVEVWAFLGDPGIDLSVNAENGEQILRRHFDDVEARPGGGEVTFPTAQELRTYVASTILRAHLAERVPDFEGPFVAHSAFMVFVAS
jgi:ubiquinone/menaquinone biosynthesis C-methylase UbiE